MITTGIKKYMGLLDNGVAVLVTLNLDDVIYESIYWYDDKDHQVLTIEKRMEDIIGPIEEYSDYNNIINDLKNKVGKIEEVSEKLERII